MFFWEEVVVNREALREGLRVLMRGKGKNVSPLTVASQLILYIGILESLVLSTLLSFDIRYMDIFTDIFSVFVLFLRQCGHLRMAKSFGKAIRFWLGVGCYAV